MRNSSIALSLCMAAGLALPFSLLADQPQRAEGPARKGVVHQPHCASCDHGEGLPHFDIRIHDPLYAHMAQSEARLAAEKARASAGHLFATDAHFAADFDLALGTPLYLRSTVSPITGVRPKHENDWRDAVGGFASVNPALVGLANGELSSNRVIRDFTLPGSGVRNVTLQQTHNGVDLFNATLRVSLTKHNQLLTFSSTMLERPVGGFVPEPIVISPQRAVALAAADAGIPINEADLAPLNRDEGPEMATTWKNPPTLRPDEPVTTKLVYFPLTRSRLVPAWAVVIGQHGVGHTYDTLIDANDGKVLWRFNRLVCSQPITFNVFPDESPAPLSPSLSTPTTFQAPQASRSLLVVTPAEVAPFSSGGWIPDGTTITRGNNVDAYTDTDNDNAPDAVRTDGGALLNFDFPLDLSQEPATYRDAAVTQMFYLSNRFHDRLYALGFTESAGNFQLDNFGLGGVGNDRVRAEVQDGGGTNNANFSTSGSDGSGARCQMYIFNGPTPDRDGAFDGDIVNHELAHGLSIRLHGGLSQIQSTGMGEGWSDFLAMTLAAKEGDDPHACYAMGPYATWQFFGLTTNYYFGIRRFPYSTDPSKNPLTFGDIDSATYNVSASVPRNTGVSNNFSVHSIGETWCNTLMECRANFMTAQGFAGNLNMLQLVVDGMAASPSSPSFLQSRDAILASDVARNGGANLGLLWDGFAQRGMGFSATGPAASTTSGVQEAFDLPTLSTFNFPDGLPTQLSPVEATTFTVTVTGTGLTFDESSGTLHYRVDGESFITLPMAPTGTNTYLATIPPLPCFSRVDYYVSVGSSAGPQLSPSTAPSAFNTAIVTTGVETIVTDTFVTNSGWTTGPNTATSGNWVRGEPLGTAAQPGADHSEGDNNCWFTGQGTVGGAIGEADVDGGRTILNSPAYDLSAFSDATVSYWRWYSNGLGNAPFADVFTVQVSTNNGSSWINAEVVGPANSVDTQPGWRFASWTLSSLGLTPSTTVRVRFIADDAGAGSLIEAAVDDFSIQAATCESGPAQCGAADIGGQGGVIGFDGVLNNNDFVVFIDAFFAQSPVADLGTQGGLPGSDGEFNNNDFVAFIDLFFAGC